MNTGKDRSKPKKIGEKRYEIQRKIQQLVSIQEKSAQEAGELCFTSRLLIQATIPHSEPKSNEWVRTNGNLTLTMLAPSSVGLPFGCYARLILIWITTQASRNKSRLDRGDISEQEARTLDLGPSLRRFMLNLGLKVSGGENGSINPFREQMNRLFKTTISVTYIEFSEDTEYMVERDTGGRVSNESCIWWRTKNKPEQDLSFNSWVELSPKFFDMVTKKPVPLDMRLIRFIKRSPMGLDVYLWATHRVSYLKRETCIHWPDLKAQFGTGYPDTTRGLQDFKSNFREGLTKVKTVWPGLDATPTKKGLLLKPCAPQVSRKQLSLRG
jgi:hypothetical protein